MYSVFHQTKITFRFVLMPIVCTYTIQKAYNSAFTGGQLKSRPKLPIRKSLSLSKC